MFYRLSTDSDEALQVEVYKRKYLKSGKLNKGRKLSLNTLARMQSSYNDEDIIAQMSFSWSAYGSLYALEGNQIIN